MDYNLLTHRPSEDFNMPINSFDDYYLSWKPDKKNIKKPIYKSLAELLEKDIIGGVLLPNTLLPPQRELADYLDINFTTVTRAYKLCELKGLIYAETGRGTFVSPSASSKITISLEHTPSQTIDLGFVSSFERYNSLIYDHVPQAYKKNSFSALLTYDDPTGILSHKKAALKWLNTLQCYPSIDNLAITAGTQNALTISLLALFSPGDYIAVDCFTYPNFIALAKMLNIKLIPVKSDNNGIIPAELENHARKKRLKGLFIVPSCNNPTTIVTTDFRKRQLAEIVKKYDLILIEDDIHAFLNTDVIPNYMGPMARYVPEQSVYICSLSKSICSGLRIAYLAYSTPFREKILNALFNVNVKTSSYNVQLVSSLINNGVADEIVKRKIETAKIRNDIFNDIFYYAPQNGHPLSFYRWLPISSNKPGREIEEYMQSKGIKIYHSDRFVCGSTNKSNEHYIRVSLSNLDNDESLANGLKRLKMVLENGRIII